MVFLFERLSTKKQLQWKTGLHSMTRGTLSDVASTGYSPFGLKGFCVGGGVVIETADSATALGAFWLLPLLADCGSISRHDKRLV